MSIPLPARTKRPSLNEQYGLVYSHIAIRRDDILKLKDLKSRTGLPITELASRAIEQFLRQVEVIDAIPER